MKTTLDPNDLKLWMSETYQQYAFLTGGGKPRLSIAVNHYGLIRVSLGSEILYHGSDVEKATEVFNENVR